MLNVPKSRPFDSVDQLLHWAPQALEDSTYCQSSISIQDVYQPADSTRLLVCHDFANGYHSDAFPQGCEDDAAFYLTQWHLIDIFIYFSHHFVTIPCPTWINCAHRNGVQVLGTLITEWEEGTEKCKVLFASETSAKQTAHQLAAIAAFFRFEGWLINIECELEAKLIPNLECFLRTLTLLMQQQCPRSQVIWYDAVTTEGKLTWQNTLNDLNRPFFDATDAIFINYSWQAGTPLEAAAAAEDRKQDVYMGIDVFGRGTFGGGQLNCNVAAAAARREGLGVALFAPGWVYEGNTGDWRRLNEQLWSSLAAVLGPPRALITALPFVTSFCPGLGTALHHLGRVVSAQPWFNLSMQSPQPLFGLAERVRVELISGADKAAVRLSSLCAAISSETAYEGGCCLHFEGKLCSEGTGISVELFKANFEVPPEGLSLVYALQQTNGAHISIELRTSVGLSLDMTEDVIEEHIPADDDWQIKTSQSSADVHSGTTVGSVWLRCRALPESNAPAEFTGAIGMMQILPVGFTAPDVRCEDLAIHNVCLTAPQSSQLGRVHYVEKSPGSQTESTSYMSFELKWKPLSETLQYNIWVSWSDVQAVSRDETRTPSGVAAKQSCWNWLGRSLLERFKVVNLAIPCDSRYVTVAVQVVNVLCSAEPIEYARRVVVPVRMS